MNLNEIKKHWESWATEFGTGLRATTKANTIKQLEVDVLVKAIKKTHLWGNQIPLNILDVGCGNGYNSFALSNFLENCMFTGVDYSPSMIENAHKIKNDGGDKYQNISFAVGDMLEMANNKDISAEYDVIFTDRCIINVNPIELQFRAFDQICTRLKKGGYLMMLENSVQAHARQNELRTSVGLPKRLVPEFNVFIDEDKFLPYAQKTTNLVRIDDFGSLHDIILYVLVPMVNGGEVDYNHPITKAATELCVSLPDSYINQFGTFGQNRLWIFQKN